MNDLDYEVTYDQILQYGMEATLFLIGDREVWLPHSQITVYEDYNKVQMPEWLLIEEELEVYSDDYPG